MAMDIYSGRGPFNDSYHTRLLYYSGRESKFNVETATTKNTHTHNEGRVDRRQEEEEEGKTMK